MVAVRRYAEGLLEGAAEMVGAQTNEPSKSCEWYLLGEVILNVACDDALLPNREATAHGAFARCATTVESGQFMGEHTAKSLDIGATVGLWPRDAGPQKIAAVPRGPHQDSERPVARRDRNKRR